MIALQFVMVRKALHVGSCFVVVEQISSGKTQTSRPEVASPPLNVTILYVCMYVFLFVCFN